MTSRADHTDTERSRLESLLVDVSVPLRRALVLRFGLEAGSDAHAEAMAFAWEHSDRVLQLHNPAGYLFRVGQSSAKRARRWGRTLEVTAPTPPSQSSDVPELDRILELLKPRHRAALVLIHGYGYSYREVAELLGVTDTAVRNYVHRALTAVRKHITYEEQQA